MKTIFIVGNSRSGTTMMGRILGNHQDIYTFHELHFFEELWSGHHDDQLYNEHGTTSLLNTLFFRQRAGYLQTFKNTVNYKKDILNILNQAKENFNSKMDVFKYFLWYETNKMAVQFLANKHHGMYFILKNYWNILTKLK